MRNERSQFLQGLFVAATERIYGLESQDRSEQNLSLVNDHLKEGSVVVYFNHVSLVDPPALIAYLFGHLDNMQNIIVPTSRRHHDIKQKPYFDGLAIQMATLINVEVLPVVQRKDYHLYSANEQVRLARKFLSRSKEVLGKPGGVLVIAPEGTRSQSGQLQKAESGFEKFGRYGRVKYVPVGLIPDGKFNRDLWIGGLRFNIGEPFDIEESPTLGGLNPEDAAMVKLAYLLPENMRGQYLSYSNDRN